MTGSVRTNGMPMFLEAKGVAPGDIERMRSSGLTWPDVAERVGYRRQDAKALRETLAYHFRKHGRAWPIWRGKRDG